MSRHDAPLTDRDAVEALASVWDQAPTVPTVPTRADILRVLSSADRPLTVSEIAAALGYHTRTPWAVATFVHDLELSGYVTRDRKPPYRVHLTERRLPADAAGGEGT